MEPPRLSNRTRPGRLRLKEPVSALTHFAGMIAALAGLVFLVVASLGDGPRVAAMAIYGSTLVLLFFASALYHAADLGERGNRWLRRLDHAAIFLLIAGTYLPAIVHLLDGAWRIALIAVVGGLALLGAIFKIAWIDCPTWLSTSLYLALGWIVVIPAYRIFPLLTVAELSWLVAGGLAYSVGAIVYARRWPNPWPRTFGFHEVWHLFVLAGAAAHFVFTVLLLDRARPPFV